MSASPIDYAAIAKQYGAVSSSQPGVDYGAIAKQFGAIDSQPAQVALPPQQPGFFQRLGQSMGIPTSRAEAQQAAQAMAPKTWTDLSEMMNPVGVAKRMIESYGQQAGQGLKKGYQEAGEAQEMLDKGQITRGQAIGKTASAALNASVNAIPVIGPSILQAGEDISQKNYAGAAGGLTGVIGQVAAPKIANKIPPNSVLGRMLLLGKTPEGAYESAMKPSTTLSQAERSARVGTALKEGIPVSQGGLEKLSGLIDDANQKIAATIASDPNRPINPAAAVQNLGQVRQRFATQVNPQADLQAIDASGQEFLNQFRNQPGGAVRNMTAEEAQAMKQGTYRALGDKAYGELKGASIEAQKALARGLKDELANQFPELSDLNARDSRLLDLQDSLERAVNRIGNHQMVGIGTPIAAAGVRAVTGSNKIAAVAGFMKAVLDNPNVKSKLAIALSQGKVPSPLVVPKIAAYAGALGRLAQPPTLPFLPGSSGSPGASAIQAPQ